MAEQVASRRGVLFGALLLGAGVAVALGVYGRAHTPDFEALPSWGFSGPGAFKSWMASGVLLLALVQLVTALWMYGKLGARRVPAGLGTFHRVTGSLAFLLSLPVAWMCLYGLGFSPEPVRARTFIHSVAGCAFYGAFAAKVVFVHTKRLPGWALPVAGGLLFTAIVVLWWTGARWWFGVEGVKF
jgi:Family of unknown function (DUF6529)